MNPLSELLSDKSKDIFDDDITQIMRDNTEEDAADESSVPSDADAEPAAETSQKPTNIDITELKKTIHAMKDQLDGMLRMLHGEEVRIKSESHPDATILNGGETVIEGVFTGDKMLGQDGKEYNVPPNYASKSKLVEGDIMKLTITNNGSFIYKQISPIERICVSGELVSDEAGQWSVLAGGKAYKILTASATFYKGTPGDQVTILVPKDGESGWGAVENIIHK
jgi:hypothetical protein